MVTLSKEELDKLPQLLLHTDPANIELGLTLLRQHPDAIPQLRRPLEVAAFLSPRWQEFRTLLQLDSNHAPLHILRLALECPPLQAQEYEQIVQFIQIEPEYRPWLLQLEEGPHVYAALAQALAPLEEFRGAAHAYYDAQQANTHLDYADFLRRFPPLGQTIDHYKDKVLHHYQLACDLRYDHAILKRLADFHEQELQHPEAARQVWESYYQKDPNNVLALLDHMRLEIREKCWPRAQQLGEKLLGIHQATGLGFFADDFFYQLGLVAWKGQQDPKTAIHWMEQALVENRYFTEPLQALMALTLAQEDHTAALRWHKMALEQAPHDVFLLMKLGELSTLIDQTDQARLYYRDILELNPYYQPAVEALEQLPFRS